LVDEGHAREVDRQFERADKIDPDSDASAAAQDDSETRDALRGTPAGKQGRPRYPEPGRTNSYGLYSFAMGRFTKT
jgi:hypothetical protein